MDKWNKLKLKCFYEELPNYEDVLFSQEYDEQPCVDEVEITFYDSKEVYEYLVRFETGKFRFVTKSSD